MAQSVRGFVRNGRRPSNRASAAMKWKKRTAKLCIEEWQQDGES
jgi:hypothetical protein